MGSDVDTSQLRMADRLINLELFGQKYTFSADPRVDNAEEVAGYLAAQVEKVMNKAASRPGRLDAVILAALNIANDYFEVRSRREAVLRDLGKRCGELISRIDGQEVDNLKNG